MKHFAIILMLVSAVYAPIATAGVSTPGFTNLSVSPQPITAGVPLSARSLYQFCDHLDEIVSSEFNVSGQLITLTVHMTPLPPDLICFATPAPPEPVFFPIGSLAPGDYTLVQQPISSDPGVIYPSLSVSFTVGPAARVIPTLSATSLALLCGLLALGAAIMLRAARRESRAP